MRFILLFFITLFFVGCAQKTPSFALNPTVFNKAGELKQRDIYTYDKYKSKITGYFFSRDDSSGGLKYTHMVVFIPIDYTGQLYDGFSNVTWALKRYAKGAETLEEAFETSVRKNGNRTLFKTKKTELIVDTKLAKNLVHEIIEFEKMIERQEDFDEEREIIIPET